MATWKELEAKHSRFMQPEGLPAGVAELFLLTKYHVDFAAPRYHNGARVRGTGGYKIFTADGAAHTGVIPADYTYENWRELLGKLLDADIRWRDGSVASVFRDPQEKS